MPLKWHGCLISLSLYGREGYVFLALTRDDIDMAIMKGKIVLVTGATSGIGKACACAFAQLGAKLILVARNRRKLAEVEHAIKQQYNIDIHSICVDLTKNTKLINAVTALRHK